MYLLWGLVSDELAAEQWDGCHAKKRMHLKSGNMFLRAEEQTHRNTSLPIHMAELVVHLAQHGVYSYQPTFSSCIRTSRRRAPSEN